MSSAPMNANGANAKGASMVPAEPGEWYGEGLRFACTQCGNCCTGPPGAVWFTPEEGQAMAAQLGMSEVDFLRKFARRLGEGWSLIERRTPHGFDCVFLDRESAPGLARCSMYKARPTQCRTWPFWPENLRTQRHWKSAKHRTPCPGMDEGKVVPVQQIRILRDTPVGEPPESPDLNEG